MSGRYFPPLRGCDLRNFEGKRCCESNSGAHPQHGEWSSIVPHTFSYMFGGTVHTQSIELVLSNHEPPSPIPNAMLESVMEGDLGCAFSQPREA
jgi:hypothetical protein